MYSIYMHIYIYIYMHTYAHVCARDSISIYIYIYIMVLSTQQNPGFFRKFTWPRPRLGDDVDHPCLLHGRYLGKDLETSADTGHGWWGKNFMTWLFRSKKVKGWGYYPWFALICRLLIFQELAYSSAERENLQISVCMYVIYIYIYHTFFYIIYIYIHFISYIYLYIYIC